MTPQLAPSVTGMEDHKITSSVRGHRPGRKKVRKKSLRRLRHPITRTPPSSLDQKTHHPSPTNHKPNTPVLTSALNITLRQNHASRPRTTTSLTFQTKRKCPHRLTRPHPNALPKLTDHEKASPGLPRDASTGIPVDGVGKGRARHCSPH